MYDDENELGNEGLEENDGLSDIGSSDDESVQSPQPQTDNGGGQSLVQNVKSFINKFIKFWRKLPSSVKGILLSTAGYVLLFFGIVIMIFLFSGSATGVAEELWQSLQESAEAVETFFEKTGNFFTGQGFVTNQEEASNQEKKYFEKLDDIYNHFLDKYNVHIDTSLITATLFYGKGMSDYIDDAEITSDDSDDDEAMYKDMSKFYRVARRHIKSLAKFQIIEKTTYNGCDSEEYFSIEPESAKEIADNWLGTYIVSYNSQITMNIQPYEFVSYPDIEGNARSIQWCEYEDAHKQLGQYYLDDKDILEEYQRDYDKCVSSQKSACRSACPVTYGVDALGNQYPIRDASCVSSCNSASYCPAEKAELEEKQKAFNSNWIDNGLYTEERDTISCTNSYPQWSEWTLLSYSGDKYVNREVISSQLKEEKLSYNQNSGSLISCSAKPSIVKSYDTSIEREGVYYYKLLSRNAELFEDLSFIERYYPDEVDIEDSTQEAAYELVDGIYDMYEYISNRKEYCMLPSNNMYGGSNYFSEDTAGFINQIANIVVDYYEGTGLFPSATIGQATHESAHGSSDVAVNGHNYFGIKALGCGAENVKVAGVSRPGENGNTCTDDYNLNDYWDGSIYKNCDTCIAYRAYNSFEQSMMDHAWLIRNSRYQCNGKENGKEQLQCIVNVGYAEDTSYFPKVYEYMQDYNLEQFDITSATVVPNDVTLVGSGSFGLNNWLFVGDSFTDLLDGTSSKGSAWPEAEVWTENYASKDGFNVFGYSGYTTAEIYDKLQSGSGLPSSANGIVVLAGINDLKDGRSIPEIKSSMGDIVDFLQSKYPNTPIYIQKVFPFADWTVCNEDSENKDVPGNTNSVNNLSKEYVNLANEKGNVYVVDTRSGFINDCGMIGDRSYDGTHISPDYYDDWLANIKSALKDAGATSSGSSSGSFGSGSNSLATLQTNCIPWTSNGSGTINGTINGVRTTLDRSSQEYLTFWGSNNNLFYSSDTDLVDECTWYAHGRGLEILTSNGMSLSQAREYLDPMNRHAKYWYSLNMQSESFNWNGDVNQPMPGAIIVWSSDTYGHVAIVEKVYQNENGETLVDISHGGKSINGFKFEQGLTISQIEHKYGYDFLGYVYLLSLKKGYENE